MSRQSWGPKEKLLGGIPRSVQSGGILLGLMAWRLYPDLNCLSATDPRIELGDSLLSGRGILTIGLEPPPSQKARSVYWTLPLAYLRYYGLPVTKFRSTRTEERDRLTVGELLFSWFYAYIKAWDNDRSIPSEQIIRYAADVALGLHKALMRENSRYKWLPNSSETGSESDADQKSWLLLLSQVGSKWATALDEPRAHTLRNLGRMFCDAFDEPFQGLLTINSYLSMRTIGLEEKVRFLREVATKLDAQGRRAITTSTSLCIRAGRPGSTGSKATVTKTTMSTRLTGLRLPPPAPNLGSSRPLEWWTQPRHREAIAGGCAKQHTSTINK